MGSGDGTVFVSREPEPRPLPELESHLMELSAELREAAELIGGYQTTAADAARLIARMARLAGPDGTRLARALARDAAIEDEIETLLARREADRPGERKTPPQVTDASPPGLSPSNPTPGREAPGDR